MIDNYNYTYNPYYPYGTSYNPYGQPYQQMPIRQPQQVQNSQYKQQNPVSLQGKVVDSLEVAKATDFPYDGSVSYFPLTNGTAIITKQLQQDGTTKIVIYRPALDNDQIEDKPKYVTESDFNQQILSINNNLQEELKALNDKSLKDIKEDIKNLKRKMEDISEDIKYKKEK